MAVPRHELIQSIVQSVHHTELIKHIIWFVRFLCIGEEHERNHEVRLSSLHDVKTLHSVMSSSVLNFC